MEHLEVSDFYINESYGDISNLGLIDTSDGITDEKIDELGLPKVPNEVLRTHRFIDAPEDIRSILLDVNKMCQQFIFEKYKRNMAQMQGGDFVRYKNNQSLPYHQDWTLSEWVKKHNLPVVHLSSVLYLNDNYKGGELYFSSENKNDYSYDTMSIKPQAGTIVFFDALTWHASAPVLSGEKYAITNFYTLD